jgi:hypothetical protein
MLGLNISSSNGGATVASPIQCVKKDVSGNLVVKNGFDWFNVS